MTVSASKRRTAKAPRTPAPAPDPKPEAQPERPTKLAGELQPGDWFIRRTVDNTDLVVQADHVQPFGQIEQMYVVYTQPTWRVPDHVVLLAHEPVDLATEDEVADALARARCERLSEDLRELADVIRERKVPLPAEDTPVSVMIRLSDADAVAEAAKVLGLTMDVNDAGRSEVEWQPRSGDARLYADFYSYPPRHEYDPTERATEVPEPLRVPPYVDGNALGGRSVSAPPAGEAGAS